MLKKHIAVITSGALGVIALASCSGNGNSPQSVTTVNPLSGKLELSVGTANIFGDTPAAAVTGLNVVTTFRQPAGAQTVGDTDALVNTPTLSGPFTLPATAGTADGFGATIATGPAATEIGKGVIGSTPQQATGSSTIPASTLGESGGATGLGLEPFNYTATGTSSNTFGAPTTFVPYAVPAYDTVAMDPNAFIPWGGPPAFDPNKDGKGERDGSALSGTILGLSEGLDVFAGVVPATGTYTMSVSVPTSATGNGTVSTTATLASAALLPAITPAVPALDGTGGGSFAVTLPAGVTEAYVQVVDIGPATTGAVSCNGSSANVPTYYTLHVTASGTAVLPDADGPTASAAATTPSLCTIAENTTASSTSTAPLTSDGDQYTVQTIGFDYPAYAASYPNSNGNPAPVIAGANGQSDITISSQVAFAQPVSAVPGSTVRTTLKVHPAYRSIRH